jgi:hypothetical protein
MLSQRKLSVIEINHPGFKIDFSWLSTSFKFKDNREYSFGHNNQYWTATRLDGNFDFCASIYDKRTMGSREINGNDREVCKEAMKPLLELKKDKLE